MTTSIAMLTQALYLLMTLSTATVTMAFSFDDFPSPIASNRDDSHLKGALHVSANIGGSITLDCNAVPTYLDDADGSSTGRSATIIGGDTVSGSSLSAANRRRQQSSPSSFKEHLMTWRRQGFEVPIFIQFDQYPPHVGDAYSGRIRLVETTAIELSDLREQDEGWYECSFVSLEGGRNIGERGLMSAIGTAAAASTSSADDGAVNGTWIYLAINAPPVLGEVSPTFLIQKEGDTVDMFCEASATPSPSLSWRKDGQLLVPSDRVRLSGSRVQLRRLERSDGGAYACTFANPVGQVSHVIRLVVEGNAYIMVPPTNITAREGTRVKLTCQAEGYPNNITYRWYHDGIDVTLFQTRSSSATGGVGVIGVSGAGGRAVIYADGSLVIASVISDDSGWYTCRPTNGLGIPPEAAAYLDITYVPRVLAMPPRIYLTRGMTSRIECPVEANPPTTIILWSRNGRTIDSDTVSSSNGRGIGDGGLIAVEGGGGEAGGRRPKLRVTHRGTLVIRAVDLSDEGRYACTPYSLLGKGQTSPTVQVLVRDAPCFVHRPDAVYQRLEGQAITLPCFAEGDPRPTLTWRKVDGNFPPSTRTLLDGSNLTIVQLEKDDQGFYECIASSHVIESVASTLLIIETSSNHAAINVTADMTPTTARVCWVPAYDAGHALHYTLWYLAVQNTSGRYPERWQTMSIVPNDTTCVTIYQLQPSIAYQFMVLARGQFGDAFFSRPIAVSTPDADDDVIDTSDTTVAAADDDDDAEDDEDEDERAADNNGNDGYGDGNGDGDDVRDHVTPRGGSGNVSSAGDSNAEPEYYEFGVPNSGPRPAPPLNVTVRVVRSDLLISWSAAPVSASSSRRPPGGEVSSSSPTSGSVTVDGYVIQYRTVGHHWVPLIDRLPNNVTSYLWTTASRGATYHFRVIAVGQRAHSEPSIVVSVRTGDPLPQTSGSVSSSAIGVVVGALLILALSVIVIGIVIKVLINRRKRNLSSRYGNIKYFGTKQIDGNHASGTDLVKNEGYSSEVFTTAEILPTPPPVFTNNHHRHVTDTPSHHVTSTPSFHVERQLKETPI